MDFSSSEVELSGQDLIEKLIVLTGLPESWIRKELSLILEKNGQEVSDVTLEQFRESMLTYLEAIQLDMASETHRPESGYIE